VNLHLLPFPAGSACMAPGRGGVTVQSDRFCRNGEFYPLECCRPAGPVNQTPPSLIWKFESESHCRLCLDARPKMSEMAAAPVSLATRPACRSDLRLLPEVIDLGTDAGIQGDGGPGVR
jgi:hypothetical protein